MTKHIDHTVTLSQDGGQVDFGADWLPQATEIAEQTIPNLEQYENLRKYAFYVLAGGSTVSMVIQPPLEPEDRTLLRAALADSLPHDAELTAYYAGFSDGKPATSVGVGLSKEQLKAVSSLAIEDGVTGGSVIRGAIERYFSDRIKLPSASDNEAGSLEKMPNDGKFNL
jgi:hypothetical protein